jgi:hypothetical protein
MKGFIMKKILGIIPGLTAAVLLAAAATWAEIGLQNLLGGMHIIGAAVIAMFFGIALNPIVKKYKILQCRFLIPVIYYIANEDIAYQ